MSSISVRSDRYSGCVNVRAHLEVSTSPVSSGLTRGRAASGGCCGCCILSLRRRAADYRPETARGRSASARVDSVAPAPRRRPEGRELLLTSPTPAHHRACTCAAPCSFSSNLSRTIDIRLLVPTI